MEKIKNIPFTAIESIPQLIKDFLTQKIEGFEEDTFNLKNIEKQFLLKKARFSPKKRAVLSKVLEEQHASSNLSEKQKLHLSYLKDENSFTVTTGHQLNLFSGPVFFVYKILQTIKMADFLHQKFPDYKTVPVFWMATEDHDFEEINHFKTENHYYETKAKSGGAVGRISVEDDFFISQFEEEFKDSVFGTELILLMKKAYRKGNTLSQATRILVQELFAEYGLIIIDGDHPELKKEITEVFRNELLHQNLFETTQNTVVFLTEKYGKVQVNPREINLFYLSETRNRIEFRNEKFYIVDTEISFSKEEIIAELENHPEKFSPNALMRPVYQESILPNLVYVGGNAEIMYWLELKAYFESLQLPFPVLVPRNSLLFTEEKTLKRAEKLGLSLNDFFRDFAAVTKGILLENNEIVSLLDESEAALNQQFESISHQAKSTDQSFGSLVDAERTRQLKSFERMRKRLLRAEKIKQNEKLERLESIFLKIHPGKIWQERVFNFSVFYGDFGREWLQNCYEEMNVEASELIVVSI